MDKADPEVPRSTNIVLPTEHEWQLIPTPAEQYRGAQSSPTTSYITSLPTGVQLGSREHQENCPSPLNIKMAIVGRKTHHRVQ